MARWRKVLTASGVCVLIVAVGCGVWIRSQSRPSEPHFCTMGLAIVEIDGRSVVFQDQAPPGREDCDLGETSKHEVILGQDCRVRHANGDVISELEPNRADGTCGLPDAGDDGFPESWKTG